MLLGRGGSVARRGATTRAQQQDFESLGSKPLLSKPSLNSDSSAVSDRGVPSRDPGPCQTTGPHTPPSTTHWRLPWPARSLARQGEDPRPLPLPGFASSLGCDVP